ncbi:MAG: hypothetical protein ACPG7U_03810 [Holosporaceae bacterium]
MTKANYTALFFLILCTVPLWATGPSGSHTQDSAANNTEPLAEGAPPVAMAAPHKVVAGPFVLDPKTLQTLQSADNVDKEVLLAKAAQAVSLHIKNCVLPDDTEGLLSPFVKVHELVMRNMGMGHISPKRLPQMPCEEKLETLIVCGVCFESIGNLHMYPNVHTLKLNGIWFKEGPTLPDVVASFEPLASLNNLRTFHCSVPHTLELDEPQSEQVQIFIRMIQNNSDLEDFYYSGCLVPALLDALTPVPLRKLTLKNARLDDAGLARLPTQMLDRLDLFNNALVNLAPLVGSPVRVLNLNFNQKLGDAFAHVVCTLPNLEKLSLVNCHLEDDQIEPLFKLAQKLTFLNLAANIQLSPAMHERLQAAFGDNLSLDWYSDDLYKPF